MELSERFEAYLRQCAPAEQERLQFLARDLALLPAESPRRCIDVGAGNGALAIGLLLLLPTSSVLMVDVQQHLAIAPEWAAVVAGRHASQSRAEFLAMSGSAPYDLVLSIDVLEHIPHWRAAFAELVRHVAPGGYLYIQTPSASPSPNWPTWRVRWEWLLGQFGRNDPNQHVRHGLGCKSLFDEAQRHGLETLQAGEDYVVAGRVPCAFKPRTHALFRRPR